MRKLLVLLLIIVCSHVCAKPQLTVRHLSTENGLGSNYIRSIVQDPRGYIWMGSINGLIRYDGYTTRLITPDNNSNSRRLMTDSRIQDIRLWQDRYILIRLRGNQYNCYDTQTDCFVEFSGNYEKAFTPRKTNRISQQLTDCPRCSEVTGRDSITWVATYGDGLYAYDNKTGETTHYRAKDNNAPIQTDYLLNIFEDKAGNLWVSQENMGVVCINIRPSYITSLFFSTPEQTDHTNSIHLLKKVGNTIFVANRNNGMKLYDGNLHTFQTADSRHDDIVAVCQDRQGTIWMGTRHSGIYVGQHNYRHDVSNANSLAKGKISDIICDRKGNVWISFFDSGVDLAVPDGKGNYRFRHFFTSDKDIAHPRQMTIDHHGYIWLSSNEGFYIFHPDRIMANPKDYHRFYINHDKPILDEVHCMTESSNHHIYAGLMGYGLAEIDNSKAGQPQLIRLYTTADGLSSNNIQQMVEDRQGFLWLGTEHGLTRFSITQHTMTSLQPSATLLGNMFIENTSCLLDDGRLAFGSHHGITIVNPKNFTLPVSPFQPRITDIDINGTSIYEREDSILTAGLYHQQEMVLDHNHNSLTFYFSDFEYAKGRTAKYSYRLKGYDRDWSPLSGINFATYKNLPPGSYTLEVRSQQENGEWGTTTISQAIVISRPFWATWWAYLIYSCIIAAIAWTTYRYFRRINELHNRIQVEQQLTEYKMQFFTNISHEFRTPLTIIRSAMDRIAATRQLPGDIRQPISAMHKSVQRLLRMVNQLMEFSKMHEGKLHLAVEETDVVAFLRDIYSTFRPMAEQKHINYQFTTTTASHIMYIDRNFVDQIAYNLISNAFKYTPGRKDITVRIRVDKQTIDFEVQDTGMGVPKDKQAALFERFNQSVFAKDSIGIGLHLSQELVREHHGTIAFRENPQGGSIFTVTLPCDKSVFKESDFLVADNILLQEENANSQRAVVNNYLEVAPQPMNDQRILIVEDDTDLCENLQSELRRYFITDTAHDGAEAIEHIREQRPDLVISDVMMPVTNGFELLRHIRSEQSLADIPVILLTAVADESKRIKGLGSGADAYITKPFSTQVLIAQCTQLLSQRQQLRNSYAKEVVKAEVPAIIVKEQEQKLRAQLDLWLANHLTDPHLSIDAFAQQMGYGRTTFYKKVKKLTGYTPNDYIRKLRMEQSAELLKDDTQTVAQVAYQVGIDDPYYFSKLFKSYYGISPTQYRKGEQHS